MEATPNAWDFCCNYAHGSFNYIPNASTSSHVTEIELGIDSTTNAIYSVNILGDGVGRTAVPNAAGCSTLSGTKNLLSVGANERITVFEAWRNSDSKWYRLRLTLNTGRTPQPEYDYTPTTGTTHTLHFHNSSRE
jgi:hypothetical protein